MTLFGARDCQLNECWRFLPGPELDWCFHDQNEKDRAFLSEHRIPFGLGLGRSYFKAPAAFKLRCLTCSGIAVLGKSVLVLALSCSSFGAPICSGMAFRMAGAGARFDIS